MEVVAVDRKNLTPVSTSVTFTLYSRIIPFVSDEGGGDHDKDMVCEFTLVPVRFCGGALGAEMKQARGSMVNSKSSVHVWITCFFSSHNDSTAERSSSNPCFSSNGTIV